jgi:capsular polysaccharide biosynthesis protein
LTSFLNAVGVLVEEEPGFVYVDVRSENIAHFLHEQLQYLYIMLSARDCSDLTVVVNSDRPWILESTRAVASAFGCDTQFARNIVHRKGADFLFGSPRIFSIDALLGIRRAIYEAHGLALTKPVSKRLLYTRSDAFRRRLLDSSRIDRYFDAVVHEMPRTFEEQLRMFSDVSHFVSVEGAHMTNVVLMRPSARVLSLQVHKENSWPKMFGLSAVVQEFNCAHVIGDQLVAPTLELGEVSDVKNARKLRGEAEGYIDFDVKVDEHVQSVVSSWLDLNAAGGRPHTHVGDDLS